MLGAKAFALLRRGPSPVASRPAVPEAAPVHAHVPAVRCRHCGGARLKLSYRRRDKSAPPDTPQTTFILRCSGCEGFTTVCA